MIIERNPSNQFATNLSTFQTVGFHATTSLASSDIEKVGFLPNKVFDASDHQLVLAEAKSLNLATAPYEQWLQMRSVTFVDNQAGALRHITQGSAGGQGLGTMFSILQNIASLGNAQQIAMATNFLAKINNIRTASSVIYAVDLSKIGIRLAQDPNIAALKHIYFDPGAPLPAVSIVSPLSIIARLDVV